MRIKGDQLYAFAELDGELKAIGCSTDCSLSLSAEAVEVSGRGYGQWRRYRPGRKSWEMTCSGFYADRGTSPTSMMGGAVAIGTMVRVAMTVLAASLVDAGIDPDTVNVDGTATLVGEAVVTQCTYSGSKGGVATYSVTFTGSGALGPQNAQT